MRLQLFYNLNFKKIIYGYMSVQLFYSTSLTNHFSIINFNFFLHGERDKKPFHKSYITHTHTHTHIRKWRQPITSQIWCKKVEKARVEQEKHFFKQRRKKKRKNAFTKLELSSHRINPSKAFEEYATFLSDFFNEKQIFK